MFQNGDAVLYGGEGVCTVDEVREMKIGRQRGQYYVLRPVYREGSTIFVPVGSEPLMAKMRRVLSREEVDALLENIRQADLLWIDDIAERKTEFHRILSGGDRRELLGMIRLLYTHRERLRKGGKRLRSSDEQSLRDAEKLLNDEFAFVLQIRPREVPEYIRSHVEEKTA